MSFANTLFWSSVGQNYIPDIKIETIVDVDKCKNTVLSTFENVSRWSLFNQE